ncbi:MAG: metallophosphoesterase, partial [Myxococcales bacterium]|nr:metallophosphoesterase [Myxococcales bacterium]
RIDGIVGRKLPVLAVPGNHDLARPTGMDALRYAGLKHHDEDPVVQRGLWLEKRAAGEAGWLDPLFAEYRAWCERTLKPRALRAGLKLIESERAPGDFRVVVEKKGLRLGVVGLNTAWGQVGDGDFLGKLPLATEQFDALFSDELPARDWFAGLSASILMTHHPRSWLSTKGRENLEQRIYCVEGSFDMAIFGHMHAAESLAEARGGTQARLWVQAPSLFGLEHYGEEKKVSRSFGYGWGRISEDGEIRSWPYVHGYPGGSLALVEDHNNFRWVHDGLRGVILR